MGPPDLPPAARRLPPMKTAAILPVKRFRESKQRLAPHLGSGTRAHLAAAMFGDVLWALGKAETIAEVFVVSSELEALQLARDSRATGLEDDHDAGQSAAALVALERLPRLGFDAALLVPGDCPLLLGSDVDDLVRRVRADKLEAAIVPDRHGVGTNALYLFPPAALEPQFGADSLARHTAQAEERGLRFRVEEVESLGLDVDTGDDLAALRAALSAGHGRAPRTKGVIGQIDRANASEPPGPTAIA